MKAGDIALPILLVLSIVAVVLVSLYSPLVEKDVRCGDTSIAQEKRKVSYIEWKEETFICNDTTNECFASRNGTKRITLAETSPNFSQTSCLTGGVCFLVVVSCLWLCSTCMSSPSVGKSTTSGFSKTTVYAFRFLGLILSGLLITAALAIFLGRVSGTLSPTFIDSCKPNPSVNELCKEALLQGKEDFYVEVNCTTDQSKWYPARASSFPLVISMLSYSMFVFSILTIIFTYEVASVQVKDPWSWLILGFALIPTIGVLTSIGCAAYFQLDMFGLDVVSGLGLGLVVAVIFVGMMFIIYPGSKDRFDLKQLLPQTMKDALTSVAKSSIPTSPV